ncbi:hypothetical protein HBF26_17170 [Luteibacter jiangsuensis]|uniref:DnaT DNA-binding domain-containing protein n=1 Tax=Luteibacter jiangsuensis TaxID=637577 RepID=A0ABX0Q9V6_9GAMM|nr:hypothetical protein [Luteibacter jiangsuensis]NID06629.1 hypothetical protein [Luteibacter jiangsuensis]
MAVSADARISTALPAHPKTKKLVKRLGGAAAWHLVCLFLWAAANRSDGDLTGMSDEDIELAVDWAGPDGELATTLADVGFLDGEPGEYRIHDWAEHNPWAAGAEARSERASFAALTKQYGRAEAARRMPEYAARILEARAQHADGVPPRANSTHVALRETANSSQLAVLDGASSSAVSTSEQCPVSDTVSVSVSITESKDQQQAAQASPAPSSEASPKRGKRLPDDWQPSPALIAWAGSDHPQVDLRIEVPKFCDYWHDKAGKDATKLDWDGTFRNWIRTAAERLPRIGGGNGGGVARPRRELTREMAR